jgi:uncharacterized cupredoxin-like copper-binding protein
MLTKRPTRRIFCASLIGILMAAPSYAADPWAHAQPITVVMVDNRFQPDHVTFQQGKAYDLRLENHGKDMHEFTAPAFFRTVTVRDRRLLANGGTDVVVQPGKSTRIFLLPHVKGEYKLTCADHDWDGMDGGITVN